MAARVSVVLVIVGSWALLLVSCGQTPTPPAPPLVSPTTERPSRDTALDTVTPIPRDIVLTWRKEAGAIPGWLRQDEAGFYHMKLEERSQAGDLPALWINQWPAQGLAHLPAPAVPFGLNLSFSGVTDAGLKELVEFPTLQVLFLSKTPVTGAGFRALAKLPRLHTLTLTFSQLSDADLQGVAELRQLHTLDLSYVPVGDMGLKHLVTLQHLRRLGLGGTQVTEAGVRELQKALPNCKMTR